MEVVCDFFHFFKFKVSNSLCMYIVFVIIFDTRHDLYFVMSAMNQEKVQECNYRQEFCNISCFAFIIAQLILDKVYGFNILNLKIQIVVIFVGSKFWALSYGHIQVGRQSVDEDKL